MSNKEVQLAVSLSLSAGYSLDREAYDLLCTISKTKNPVKLLEAVLERLQSLADSPLCIEKTFLEEIANEIFPEKKEIEPHKSSTSMKTPTVVGKGRVFQPLAKGFASKVRVIEDPTQKIDSTGTVDGYLQYFRDRFDRMQRLLRRRMDCRDAISIKEVFKSPPRARVKTIAMVSERRESRSGVWLVVEDSEASATVLIPKSASRELQGKVKALLPDQVVGLSLLKGSRSLLLVEDVLFPDIPQKRQMGAIEDVNVALISDLHVGSKEFMQEEFSRFLLWLNGKYGNVRQRDAAGLVKYVVIAGDIVDGVGVYPKQIEELSISDIFEQYNFVAEFFEQIPDYIELILIPGNHDATRKALPQPALSKEYIKPLFDKHAVLSLGNPAVVSIDDVEFLLYHGRSLDDVLATAADMDFHSPDRAMRLLLKSRHLAPTYGKRTLLSPEGRDFLVIDRVPDVFHAGHVHVMKYQSYRGTLMVNSGAWQKQTSYQRNFGLIPTPGIIPVVNLRTFNILPIDFSVQA